MNDDSTTQILQALAKLDQKLDDLDRKTKDAFESISAELAQLDHDVSAIYGLPTKDDYSNMMTAVVDIAAKFDDHGQAHSLDDNDLRRLNQRLDELAQHLGYHFKTS